MVGAYASQFGVPIIADGGEATLTLTLKNLLTLTLTLTLTRFGSQRTLFSKIDI